ELVSTENRIAFARQYYNDEVMRYNTRVESFPSSIIAGFFGFTQSDFFEVDDIKDRQAIRTGF
ncbi:MAG: LemA family protein, partial [bacterium]|nr:LemA family protein [bacterium]